MKILAVCGMGVGTSLIIKMQVEKAAKQLGINATVELADILTARALAADADLVVTSEDLAKQMGEVDTPIVTIFSYLDLDELVGKLEKATSSLSFP